MKLVWETQAIHECDHPLTGEDIIHQVRIYALDGMDPGIELSGYLGIVKETLRPSWDKSMHLFHADTREELEAKMRQSHTVYGLRWTLDHAEEDCWCH